MRNTWRLKGLKKLSANIKSNISHYWKYHKLSSIGYLLAASFAVTSIVFGALMFRNNITLTGPLLSFGVMFSVGVTIWLTQRNLFDSVYEIEQKKETPTAILETKPIESINFKGEQITLDHALDLLSFCSESESSIIIGEIEKQSPATAIRAIEIRKLQLQIQKSQETIPED